MTKNEIADVLAEIGTLLELKGENPFKIRAYQTGARALEAYPALRDALQRTPWPAEAPRVAQE